jgi:hypothetical protein
MPAEEISFLKRDPQGRALEIQWPHFMKFQVRRGGSMGKPNGRTFRLFVGVLSLSILLLICSRIGGRESEAQVHRGADGKTDSSRTAVTPAAGAERVSTELQVQLRLLRSRVETLEMRQEVLRRQARVTAQEIERLEGLFGGAEGAGAGGLRSPAIDPVIRTGGRPDAKDAMVSMAGMLAIWRQIDAILDTLDEVTTALSGP